MGRRGMGWARKYPPLATLLVALLIAALVLPSALNVPQANPTEVAEFAPVPPEDDDPPPPPEGALSELGLGTTESLTAAVEEPPEIGPPPDLGGGLGERPVTKRCVGNPPRQTEDPNSPPCVAHWEGDNQGETWQGVDGDTINILVYISAHQSILGSEGSEQTPPAGTYCDVDGKPANSDPDNCGDTRKGLRDHSLVSVVRSLSRFFNERFQIYDRKAHFWIYWTGGSSASARRAEAHDNWETVQPFSVIDYAFFGGFNDQYADAISRRRVSVYGNFGALPNSYYRERAPYIWNFWPDVERWVEPYVSYVCQKVAPYPVLHSGMDEHMGEPRRYALMRYGGTQFEGLRLFGRLTADRLREGCPDGTQLDIVDEVTFPRHSFSIDSDPSARDAARENIASMRSNDVTTILWLGGYEVEHSAEAGFNEWYPEWVIAGDLWNDNQTQARWQEDDVWRHAWAATNQLREDRDEEAPCRMAFREADPRGTGQNENQFCELYRAFFMLFRGIQAAGPRLTPFTVEQGNQAIPRAASTSPFTAACWFDPNDFTCVKDMHETWWDPDAPDPNDNPDDSGCWRMTHEGLRSIPWEWRGDGHDVFREGDPCNNVRSGVSFIGT